MIKRLLLIFCFLLLTGAGAVVWFAWYVSTPLLQPISEQPTADIVTVESLHTEKIQATSHDGTVVEALLVHPAANGALSPRQSRMQDLLKMRGNIDTAHHQQELIVIATTWDKGLENSLPLAESLTGAGYSCLVWSPRGKNNTRSFCTYGLKEAADVTVLLDAVVKKYGDLASVAAVGQGFGAAVLLKAAAHDTRIRSLVSMDCFASLKTVASREMEQDWHKPLSFAAYWLLDVGVNWRADFSTFDITPVDDALKLDYPIMIVCSNQYFFSTLDDNLLIYDAVKNPRKQVFEPAHVTDLQSVKERIHLKTIVGKHGEVFEKSYPISLYAGDEELLAEVAEWIATNTHMPMPFVLPADAYSSRFRDTPGTQSNS